MREKKHIRTNRNHMKNIVLIGDTFSISCRPRIYLRNRGTHLSEIELQSIHMFTISVHFDSFENGKGKKPSGIWHNKKGRSRAQWLSSLSSLEIVHNVNNSKWWTWRYKYSLKHYLNFGAYILFYFSSLSISLFSHDSISYFVWLYVRTRVCHS